MRLFSYVDQNNQKRVGGLKAADSQEFVDLAATDATLPKSLLEIIATPGAMGRAQQALKSASAVVQPLKDVRFIPLIDRPSKIVCLGLNYADHAAEGGHARPENPSFLCVDPAQWWVTWSQ